MIHKCEKCQGKGYTKRLADCKIRCSTCNGNGLDAAEYFRWGPHKPLQGKDLRK